MKEANTETNEIVRQMSERQDFGLKSTLEKSFMYANPYKFC